ncbi:MULTISPECIES: hypothetical protein [Sorangium]|uniref:hypothetical protein n=1 Tax=Sorangium TaxID=39643 RepID=UPI00138AFC75|nr:hypothetical protein [Sorangium cellulosum]
MNRQDAMRRQENTKSWRLLASWRFEILRFSGRFNPLVALEAGLAALEHNETIKVSE